MKQPLNTSSAPPPQTFVYGSNEVRTMQIDGALWFAASDVCSVLDIGNSRQALARLDDDEKGVTIADTLGGPQEIAIVNEPGLYSLVLRSRKPEAKQFKRWVTHDVIPQIRKTGQYAGAPLGISEDPIIALGMSVIEIRRAQLDVEKRVAALERQRDTAAEALMALPSASAEVRPQMIREQCCEAIAQLHHLTGWEFEVCWQKAYFRYNQCLHVNATKRAKNARMKRLDWVESCGKIDVLYAIIADIIKSVKTTL